ncbi:MAG TPA: hypothetical protein VFE96_05260 [Candidatus Bathyarchaeia archaeon]|nr:hypothetical protein [Candidatus Bathyarchaeia archaeon]
MSKLPATTVLGKLDTLKADTDQFRIKDREIYLYCPNGYGRTKVFNSTFERLLLVDATTRNWRTTSVLAEMSLDRA